MTCSRCGALHTESLVHVDALGVLSLCSVCLRDLALSGLGRAHKNAAHELNCLTWMMEHAKEHATAMEMRAIVDEHSKLWRIANAAGIQWLAARSSENGYNGDGTWAMLRDPK